MKIEGLIKCYHNIVRSYIRDSAIFDEKMKILYPKEYETTMDTYAWIDHFFKNTLFPELKNEGYKEINGGMIIPNGTIKLLNIMNKDDFERTVEYFESRGVDFWENIPDLGISAKELEYCVNNKEIEEEQDIEQEL